MEFEAKAIVKRRLDNGSWLSEPIVLRSVDDILDVFKPCQKDVEQVNLSLNYKVYYSVGLLTTGVEAHVKDKDGDISYMCSPLLLVECDNEKPVDISEEGLKTIEEAIDFF